MTVILRHVQKYLQNYYSFISQQMCICLNIGEKKSIIISTIFQFNLTNNKQIHRLDMNHLLKQTISRFSSITYLKGKSEMTSTTNVRLRGIKIDSVNKDSPNLIFFPEVFDQAESWLPFFTNPKHKILENRNVYIIYPRNFGNSDHTSSFNWEQVANDVSRFMYENQITMATLGGHGLGGKVALVTGCYHLNRATGIFGFDSTPTNQYFFESAHELKGYIQAIRDLNLNRGYGAIAQDLKKIIDCPKWRSIFTNNLLKSEGGYRWNFNYEAVSENLLKNQPCSLWNWPKLNGLYTGRAHFTFPEYSRFVHLATNTLPMMKICTQLKGFNQGISFVQGDENPLSHWIYELEDEVNPHAYRLNQFLKNYDGVHVLLQNREEVGKTFIPDLNLAKVVKDDYAGDRQPAHYYHNWRFNNPYTQ